MRPLWDKAVKFIEANESRIRIETQTVQGEDFEVWRWLPVSRRPSLCYYRQFNIISLKSCRTMHIEIFFFKDFQAC